MYVFIVFNLQMSIQLYNAKGITDVAPNKNIKYVSLSIHVTEFHKHNALILSSKDRSLWLSG